MKTPYKRLNKIVFDEHQFKTIEEAQEYIRKNNKSPDYIAIDGILYTMEEYDNDGQIIMYANRRNGLTVVLDTENRYKNGFGDAVLTILKASSWRNDIVYAD
jgi:hypothetical protein